MDEERILKKMNENTKIILELFEDKNILDEIRLRIIEKRINLGDDDFRENEIRTLNQKDSEFKKKIQTKIAQLNIEINGYKKGENIEYKVN